MRTGARDLGRDGVDAPERAVLVGAVAEDSVLVLGREERERVQAPAAGTHDPAHAVEAPPHVRSLAHRDQALRAEVELLAAEPQRRRVSADIRERLLQVQIALLDGTRIAGAPVLEGAPQLDERAQPGRRVDIGVQQVALEERPVRVLRRLSPHRVV